MDGPNPSEMDIKVFIHVPTFFLQLKKVYSPNGKRKRYFLSWDNEKKFQKDTECMTLKNMANINIHHPRVHFINNNNGSLFFTLWN